MDRIVVASQWEYLLHNVPQRRLYSLRNVEFDRRYAIHVRFDRYYVSATDAEQTVQAFFDDDFLLIGGWNDGSLK